MRKMIIIAVSVFVSTLLVQAGQTIASENVQKDIVLVLDNSGSMRKNDPQFLTKKVVSDFIEGLSADTHVGIVIFDQKVKPAVSLSALDRAETKQKIIASLSEVNYRGELTDSPAGVERAIYELKSKGRKDAIKAIVFMTDGIVDTGDNARDLERAKWLREELAAESQRLGIRIFGIAFTEEADFQLIQALGQKTGGGYFRALKADEIAKIFEEIDAAIRKPPVQPAVTPVEKRKETKAWLIVVVGIIVLGIVAIAIGRGRKRAAGVPAMPAKIPKASLKDIREITGKHEYPIESSVVSIGRAATNDVIIDKPTVSTKHATIEYRDNVFYLVDQRSTNGTYLNGKRITTDSRLRHGDKIKFDEYEFTFVLAELVDETKTQLRGDSGETVAKPQRGEPPGGEGEDEQPTKLKDMCPNHPAWKATELCPICKTAYCEKCVVEKEGQRICKRCAGIIT